MGGRPRRGAAVMQDDAAIERRVRETLDSLGAAYHLVPCDPAFADTAAFCARYGIALEDSANTIVVAARRDPGIACACVVLATTRLDVNHAVCAALGVRKASFASAELTRELTGMAIGGVTPFGLPGDLPVFVDVAVMQRPSLIVGGGSRSIKLRIVPEQLSLLPAARVIPGLAAPREER